jgi:hypothetical protein
MIISKSQLNKLLIDVNNDLALQAYDHLNKFMPEELEMINKDDFINAAKQQIENSKKYGIESSTDQLRYILVAFIFGEQFDRTYNLYNEILTKWELENSQKVEFLLKAATSVFNVMDEA